MYYLRLNQLFPKFKVYDPLEKTEVSGAFITSKKETFFL